MKIFDPEIAPALAAVEGEAWWEEQRANRSSPYGFFAWLAAWNQYTQAGGEKEGHRPGDFIDGGDGAIYGNGGWNRYVVRPDGEIVLLQWSSGSEARRLAVAHGIRVA